MPGHQLIGRTDDFFTLQENLSRRRLNESGNGLQQRALACS
jgi:hypothetical protein